VSGQSEPDFEKTALLGCGQGPVQRALWTSQDHAGALETAFAVARFSATKPPAASTNVLHMRLLLEEADRNGVNDESFE